MATGSEEQLQRFTEWCHKGPEKAVVTHVIATPLSEETFDEFMVVQAEYPHDI